MTLDLPYPPSTNHAYAVVRGRKVKTAIARAYAHEVGWRVANSVRTDPNGWRPTSTDRLTLTIAVYPPDRRRRDLSNVEKLCTDAVCAQLGVDDGQVDRLTLVRMQPDRQNSRLVLTLEAIS